MIAASITVALVLGYEQTQALLASWHARLVLAFIDPQSVRSSDHYATEAKAHNDRVRLALEMLDGIIERLKSAQRAALAEHSRACEQLSFQAETPPAPIVQTPIVELDALRRVLAFTLDPHTQE